jgi:hypothetical protein
VDELSFLTTSQRTTLYQLTSDGAVTESLIDFSGEQLKE